MRDSEQVAGRRPLLPGCGDAECQIADPARYPSSSVLPFGEYFGLLAVGLILSLVGTVQLAVGFRLNAQGPTLSASL